MAAICVNAEQMVEVNKRFSFLRNHTPKPMTGAEAVCSGAVMTALDTAAKAIICVTSSGRAPALVAKYRPGAPVLVVTPDEQLVRHCRSVFGLVGLLVPSIDGDITALLGAAVAYARAAGLAEIADGDTVVVLQRRKATAQTQVGVVWGAGGTLRVGEVGCTRRRPSCKQTWHVWLWLPLLQVDGDQRLVVPQAKPYVHGTCV